MRMSINNGIKFLRYSMGGMFVLHGLSKVIGGTGVLTYVGGMPPFAPHDSPRLQLVLGSLAAAFEILGGLGVITGFKFRQACLLIILVMLAATTYHMSLVKDFSSLMANTWPIEILFVFVSLLMIDKCGCASCENKTETASKS
jgi:putative oxidoreductase